ncbi:hypothetical protein AGDE_15673 [Angomonas deanei]|uniref:Uncharacterized protein n=1 Tax=Angomonas deanei TaxID=59799 RepID=A0A7G2CR17_9TRYP|nr:hypothetical protein AGDE_15673 [Angomonas deanei]CAD2222210.1 hypothetical protein, conserved [Angomonas deanei]|eukprot:EPY18673.1 hypothetical protein AGDE_15673 [Angomonas deanei]
MTLESLRALSAIESSEWWRCRRASLPWVRQAHEQNSVQFADLKELFRPTESSIGPSAMDFALNLVKENVPVGDDEFPGTLCSPLRRTHLRQIHTEPYWMTEKSDGLRVIATLLECESFPTWRRADGTLFADSVQLVAALESRVAGDGMDLFPSLGGHHFTLEPSGEAIYTLTVEGSAPVTLHRRLERVLLTYAFDRLMDQLYLFDIFYQSSSMPFSRCIIDGELMQVCNADGTCGADLTQLVIGFFRPVLSAEQKGGFRGGYRRPFRAVPPADGCSPGFGRQQKGTPSATRAERPLVRQGNVENGRVRPRVCHGTPSERASLHGSSRLWVYTERWVYLYPRGVSTAQWVEQRSGQVEVAVFAVGRFPPGRFR